MARRAAIAPLFAPVLAAWAAVVFASERTPPRLLARPADFDECRAESADGLGKHSLVRAELHLEKDGTLGKVELGDGVPGWAADLAQCALRKLQFAPALRDGRPVTGVASLEVRMRALDVQQATGVGVAGIGSFITAPMLTMEGDVNACFPESFAQSGQSGKVVVSITVQPDGSVSDIKMPVGSEREQETAARCMIERVKFFAGTVDGRPVVTEATLPIVLRSAYSGTFGAPKPVTTAAELEVAYQACIPRDVASAGSAFYRFTISSRGKVKNPELVKTSGDPRLDEAGLCVVKMLKFAPATDGGRAVDSKVTWELPMRPPR